MSILICIIFFLSGISALIFEALWFRLAGLAFGNSVWAASIVLASFMGGLALGNSIIAAKGDSNKAPVWTFAILEFIIGLSGIILVLIFPNLIRILVPIFNLFIDNTVILNFIRAGVSFLLMMIPTTAMGATLPLLVKSLSKYNRNYGNVLGVLYGINTLGAVVGVLACEFLLVKMFGIQATAYTAGMFNIIAAVIALLVSKKMHQKQENTISSNSCSLEQVNISLQSLLILVSSFFTGLVFLGLEVIWFRLMLLFKNSFSSNFSIMLAMVLAGISAGGVIAAAWFKHTPQAHKHLPSVVLLNGILVAVIYALFGFIVDIWPGKILYNNIFLFSFYMVFPVAVVSGIIFTMMGKALQENLKQEAKSAGILTLTNTLGAMCGAPISGYLLIPLIGVEKSFFMFAFTYGAIALLLALGRGVLIEKKQPRSIFMSLSIVFIIGMLFFPFGVMKKKFLSVRLKYFYNIGEKCIALREGTNETIQYLKKELFGKLYYFRLVTNAHSMAATSFEGRRYMKMFVYWPIAVHPKCKDALLICYGTGMTAKALTDTKSLKNIDIVDISKDVLDFSKIIFLDSKDNPLNDPRVTVHIEDGRFFLLTSKKKFDLITAEPPPPKYNGVVNLYTQEFFELIYNSLNDGGIVTYWLPCAQLSEDETKAILKGFCNVFNHSFLWSGASLNWMMVGVKNPTQYNSANQFAAQWKDQIVGQELLRLGIKSPEQFSALFIADSNRLKDWIGETPPLKDNFPKRLSDKSYDFQKNLSIYLKFRDSALVENNFINSSDIKNFLPINISEKAKKYFSLNNTVDLILYPADHKYFIIRLHETISNPLLNDYISWVLDSNLDAQEIITDVLSENQADVTKWLDKYTLSISNALKQSDSASLEKLLQECKHLAVRSIVEQDYLTAEKYYNIISSIVGEKDDFICLRIYLLYKAGEKEQALQLRDAYVKTVSLQNKNKGSQVYKFYDWLDKEFPSK